MVGSMLNPDQADALQELMNVSMGQAANALAQLIETEITISIPNINALTPSGLFDVIQTHKHALHTRQSFLGDIDGEVMTVLSNDGLLGMARLMDYEEPLTASDTDEVVLDLCNILAGACFSGLSSQLGLITTLNMPTQFIPNKPLFESLSWHNSLVMEVQFKVSATSFSMRVIICLDNTSLGKILHLVDELLA